MKKILLVDDDPDIRDSLSAILSQHFNVQTAENGRQALEHLRSHELPGLILLDVQMDSPQEGFELAKNLAVDKKMRAIPVIIITGTEAVAASDATAHIARQTLEKYRDNSVNVLVIKTRDARVQVEYVSKKDGSKVNLQVEGYHSKPVNPEKLIREIHLLLDHEQ